MPVSDLYEVRSVELIGSTVLVTATVTDAGRTIVALDMLFRAEPLFTPATG